MVGGAKAPSYIYGVRLIRKIKIKVMISNVDYLIQKYAEAREKMRTAANKSGDDYWRGAMDTYHNLLCSAFPGWADTNSVGYFVFIEGYSYDQALNQTIGILK